MAYEFKYILRVQFVDTDMAGIVHFSRFFHYMEATEHAFYRSLGFNLQDRKPAETVGFPRLHVACKFSSPLFFEDQVEVQLRVREIRERTIRYDFVFRRLDEEGGQVVARGESMIACIRFGSGRARLKSIPFPGELIEQLDEAPTDAS